MFNLRHREKSVMAVALCVQIIGEHTNSLLLVWPNLLEKEDVETWELLRDLYHKIAHTYMMRLIFSLHGQNIS